MDEQEEINIVSDPDFLKSDYTVHPQWLLDRPSTNPDCWYNNSPSNKPREDSDPDPIRHITTENSITDESGWTEKEKTLLERGIEIFGKSPVRLSQFIGTKSPSEIKYYFKSFYMDLHPTHSAKIANRESRENFVPLPNILMDYQIPCTSKQIVVNDTTKKRKRKRKRSSLPKELKANKVPKQKHRYEFITPNNTHGKTKPVSATSSSNGDVSVKPKLLQGEIVHMTKHSDSDVEIDIEEDDDYGDAKTIMKSEGALSGGKRKLNEPPSSADSSENEGNATEADPVLDQLTSLDIPRCEVKLEENSLSDLEKYVFSEFLSQTSSTKEKSTENYLKLRNHIIFIWNYKKPNYLTKGDIQKGYKPSIRGTLCKIHNFLEQTGVINYGCGRVRYIRPMQKIFKNKADNKLKSSSQPKRFKKKFLYNGEGGCTMSHGAHGEIIDATVINQDPVHPKSKTVKKQRTYLIYCKSLPQEYKYKLKLHLSTLLLMDFHAHSSWSEVMGLVGGSWDPITKTLSIMHYEPCKNLASSTTHCDMCPLSQSKAAEKIDDLNMNLLGWFHSHPTFAPEPSQQDLNAQRLFQRGLGDEVPCVGVILSPYNRPTVLTSSEYRCLILDKLEGDERLTPYKFKVEIVSEHFDLDNFLSRMMYLQQFITINRDCQPPKLRIHFQDSYTHDKRITFFEKYISSARMTLERYLSEQFCQKIVKRIATLISDDSP